MSGKVKDPVISFAAMRVAYVINDSAKFLRHVQDCIPPDMKDKALANKGLKAFDKTMKACEKEAQDHGDWKTVLYRRDGTVDTNMTLFGWTEAQQNLILNEMVHSLKIEKMDLESKFQSELSRLRQLISQKEHGLFELQENVYLAEQQLKKFRENNETLEAFTKAKSTIDFTIKALDTLCTTNHDISKPSIAHESLTAILQKLYDSVHSEKKTIAHAHSTISPIHANDSSFNSSSFSNRPRSPPELYGNPGVLYHKLHMQEKMEQCKAQKEVTTKPWRRASDLALSGRAKVLGEKINRKTNPLTASDAVSFAEEEASSQEVNKSLEVESLSNELNKKLLVLAESMLLNKGLIEDYRCGHQSSHSPGLNGEDVEVLNDSKSILSIGNDNLQSSEWSRIATGQSVSPTIEDNTNMMHNPENLQLISCSEEMMQHIIHLNQRRNHYINEILKIDKSKNSLFYKNHFGLEAEAEAYYANTLKLNKNIVPPNVVNWSKKFLNGSATRISIDAVLNQTLYANNTSPSKTKTGSFNLEDNLGSHGKLKAHLTHDITKERSLMGDVMVSKSFARLPENRSFAYSAVNIEQAPSMKRRPHSALRL